MYFGVVGVLCHVVTHFEALDELVFVEPSEFIGILLPPNGINLIIVINQVFGRQFCKLE